MTAQLEENDIQNVFSSLLNETVIELLESQRDIRQSSPEEIRLLVNDPNQPHVKGDIVFSIKHWIMNKRILHPEDRTRICILCSKLDIPTRLRMVDLDPNKHFFNSSIEEFILLFHPGILCMELFLNLRDPVEQLRLQALRRIEDAASLFPGIEEQQQFKAGCILSSLDSIIYCISDAIAGNIVEIGRSLFQKYALDTSKEFMMKRDKDGAWLSLSFDLWVRMRYISASRDDLRRLLRDPGVILQGETVEDTVRRKHAIASKLIVSLIYWHLLIPASSGFISLNDLNADLQLMSQVLWKESMSIFTAVPISWLRIYESSNSTNPVVISDPRIPLSTEPTVSLLRLLLEWIRFETKPAFRSMIFLFVGNFTKATLLDQAVEVAGQRSYITFQLPFIQRFVRELQQIGLDRASLRELERNVNDAEEIQVMNPELQRCCFFIDLRFSANAHVIISSLFRVAYLKIFNHT